MCPYIREQKHRLSLDLYRGFVKVHFTLCLNGRQPVFTNIEIFNVFRQLLLNELPRHHVQSEVYLFMPDHAHILLSGVDDAAYLYRCIVAFKRQTGYWFSNRLSSVRWQKDFYDHILRKDEDTEKVIWYILNNPVRLNLLEDWKEYPYKGSTVHDFKEW